MSRLAVALVGWGRFGEALGTLVSASIDALTIRAIVEPDPIRRSHADKVGVETFGSLEELLERSPNAFEAAILTSPNAAHCRQAIALASHGKHIFCEKPMALTSQECAEMVAAATANRVRLMVGHKRRLRPAWARLRQLASEGELGALRAVNVTGWHNHPDIPSWWLQSGLGGGLLHRAGVHDVDFCNALLGDPLWVEATEAWSPVGADFGNVMWVTIGYRGPAVAGLQVALGFAPVHFRSSFSVAVLGTVASAHLTPRPGAGQELIWGADPERLARESYEDGYEEAYRIELESFATWIREGSEPVLGWREGWQTVRVMEGAYAAASNGRRVELEPLAAGALDRTR